MAKYELVEYISSHVEEEHDGIYDIEVRLTRDAQTDSPVVTHCPLCGAYCGPD